jgi:hypothetical protein
MQGWRDVISGLKVTLKGCSSTVETASHRKVCRVPSISFTLSQDCHTCLRMAEND